MTPSLAAFFSSLDQTRRADPLASACRALLVARVVRWSLDPGASRERVLVGVLEPTIPAAFVRVLLHARGPDPLAFVLVATAGLLWIVARVRRRERVVGPAACARARGHGATGRSWSMRVCNAIATSTL